jgi:uncharacterized protein YutD
LGLNVIATKIAKIIGSVAVLITYKCAYFVMKHKNALKILSKGECTKCSFDEQSFEVSKETYSIVC